MKLQNYKKFFSVKYILYGLISLFILIFMLVEINYNQSILGIIMTIILGLFLTQWYLFVGLIKTRNKDQVNFFKQRSDGTLLPRWQIISLSVLITIYIISLGYVSDENFDFYGATVIFLYIMGPLAFLLIKKWSGFFMGLTVLWVWFPIEWGVISDAIKVDLGFPFSSLVGLFALLWPAIMLGRHTPWYDWNFTKKDLKFTNISIIVLTILVVPLGIILYFLKINFAEFTGKSFGESLGLIVFTIFAIFVVQGIMEETLFRDIIMKHGYNRLKYLQDNNKLFLNKFDYGMVSIILGGILIISIPFWGPIIRFIANLMPIFSGVATVVGDLHLPLGEYEGVAIPAFVGLPVWPFYLIVGLLMMVGGIILYKKTNDPLMAALAVSAMIFGFAHFQDWRYVLFATFAGYGYGYTFYKTKNLLASSAVHMGVDAVWSLILAYP